MNKQIQKQWVKALRSGRYKQATESLLDDSGGIKLYCCLGVLCKLAEKAKIGKFKQDEHGDFRFFSKDGKEIAENENLPKSVMKWAGLTDNFGFSYDGKTLIDYNDTEDYSFKQIADIIEKQK